LYEKCVRYIGSLPSVHEASTFRIKSDGGRHLG